MKKHTTMKNIRNNWEKVYKCGACELQHIFRYVEPEFYNAGLYGWNCDVYVDYVHDVAICAGYRNMVGKQIPHDLIEKYSKIAENILEDTLIVDYNKVRAALDENIENFLNALESLEKEGGAV